eukprot:TRINITY_DN5648_c0_g1_i1.p1 TRINITY_DN5648_c0_g1~~TRINITY_DN5648_c0_g1_i1.p1  ORF type:complete len:210 (+),score=64.47 TRINITY_DN5648_c0_g1_i1:74-631(+)
MNSSTASGNGTAASRASLGQAQHLYNQLFSNPAAAQQLQRAQNARAAAAAAASQNASGSGSNVGVSSQPSSGVNPAVQQPVVTTGSSSTLHGVPPPGYTREFLPMGSSMLYPANMSNLSLQGNPASRPGLQPVQPSQPVHSVQGNPNLQQNVQNVQNTQNAQNTQNPIGNTSAPGSAQAKYNWQV